MFLRNALVFAAAWLPLAACGSSGSANTPSTPAIQVTMDTAGGNPAMVSVQVVGVVLERPDGSRSDNLLAAPLQLTLSDPSGTPSGMTLPNAPTGSYTSLLFVVVPGSGAAQYPDGRVLPIDFPAAELRAGFEEPITHGAHGSTGHSAWVPGTWLAVRHAAPVVLIDRGQRLDCTPQLVGSTADEQLLAGVGVVVTAVSGESIYGTIEGDPNQPVQLECEPAAELFDEEGNQVTRASFLASCVAQSEVSVTGTIDSLAIVRVRRARCAAHTDNPRLIGRIVELLPAETSFWYNVQAITRRRGRETLPVPERLTVLAATANISWSHTYRQLQFDDLRVGDLAKVTWTTREGDIVTGSSIEITGRGGMPAHPEFQGNVVAVPPAGNIVVVSPTANAPILVNGVPVASLEVSVMPTTEIVRRERSGHGRSTTTLEGIVAGRDQIWIRGTVTGPASVDADWIRVREQD